MVTIMDDHKQAGGQQAALWNGPAARAWMDTQDLLDEVLKPFEQVLVDAVVEGQRNSVLDVGCGTGSTTLAIARRLGAAGRCVGADISEPMIARARARADRERNPASFICGDAQIH